MTLPISNLKPRISNPELWKNSYIGQPAAGGPSDTGVAKVACGAACSRDRAFAPTKANAPKGADAKPWVYGPPGRVLTRRRAATTIARLPKDAQARVIVGRQFRRWRISCGRSRSITEWADE